MCGHCGCQGVDAIGELRDEHTMLLERALGAVGCATVDRAHHDLPTSIDDRTLA